MQPRNTHVRRARSRRIRPACITVLIAVLLVAGVRSIACAQSAHAERGTHELGAAKEPDGGSERSGHLDSRLTDKFIPLQLDGFPQRPRPILEIGENFLGTGTLNQGFKIPTGAVWQPYFIVFGTARSGLQYLDDGSAEVSEWANRLDLFGNLYLTFTERILVGVRPLDRDGRFTSYLFAPDDGSGGVQPGYSGELNFELTTLFFEGDFGEIFPALDREDKRALDFGFSVGRQPLRFQEGILINDDIDAVGITKTNWKSLRSINFRWTLLYGWNELNRTNLTRNDDTASLYGLFTETDWHRSTVALDLMYVSAGDTGDGAYGGLSAVQRIGRYNTSLRIATSFPDGRETLHNSNGTLLFTEISWTPHRTHNLVYLNVFAGIDDFRSASRDPSTGGPLGRAGILFASPGLGRAGTPLSNAADRVVGGALGRQMFFARTRHQLILELGGRYSVDESNQSAVGCGARYQFALGRRSVIVLDAFGTFDFDPPFATDRAGGGGRLEYMLRL